MIMKKTFMCMCIFLVYLSLSSSQCTKYGIYTIDLINNSGHNIGYHFATGGIYGTYYPDTLLPTSNDYIMYDISKILSPGYESHVNWNTFFSRLPKDTLSVFVFHTDTLNKYTWTEVRDRYMILKRYDLSLADLEITNFRITYPPPETMKEMKMYPPYGSE